MTECHKRGFHINIVTNVKSISDFFKQTEQKESEISDVIWVQNSSYFTGELVIKLLISFICQLYVNYLLLRAMERLLQINLSSLKKKIKIKLLFFCFNHFVIISLCMK